MHVPLQVDPVKDRTGHAFIPLMIALSGKRPVELELNPLMGNKLITTDKIFFEYHFIIFKKSIHKKLTKLQYK